MGGTSLRHSAIRAEPVRWIVRSLWRSRFGPSPRLGDERIVLYRYGCDRELLHFQSATEFASCLLECEMEELTRGA
jgi:hypothetical protein